jgi:hypothetical protein
LAIVFAASLNSNQSDVKVVSKLKLFAVPGAVMILRVSLFNLNSVVVASLNPGKVKV